MNIGPDRVDLSGLKDAEQTLVVVERRPLPGLAHRAAGDAAQLTCQLVVGGAGLGGHGAHRLQLVQESQAVGGAVEPGGVPVRRSAGHRGRGPP
jgi:hypothetical protein